MLLVFGELFDMNRSNFLKLSILGGLSGCSGVNIFDGQNYKNNKKTGFNVTPNVSICTLKELVGLGFRIFRVSFADGAIFDKNNPKNINENSWEKLVKIINFVIENDSTIVIDPHTYIGFSNKYTTHPRDKFWFDADIQNNFRCLWRSIFIRLSNFLPINARNSVWVDFLNEPVHFRGGDKNLSWQFLAKNIAYDCHEFSEGIQIVLQPARLVDSNGKYMSWRDSILSFKWVDDMRVIPSWHMYYPMELSHFGVFDTVHANKNIVFPFTDSDGFVWSDDTVKFFLKDIVSFFIDSFGNSPYIGEFGASVFSGKYGDLYLSALVRAFSILNLDWTFHSFRENAIWSPESAGKENWSACKISQSRRIDILKGVS